MFEDSHRTVFPNSQGTRLRPHETQHIRATTSLVA